MSVSFSCCGITCGSDKKKLEARVGQEDIGAALGRVVEAGLLYRERKAIRYPVFRC